MAKKKRLSGAQWRKLCEQGLTSNKVGRPRGSVRMHQLYQDITNGLFEKDPDWPYWKDWPRDARSIAWQLSRQGDFAKPRLICALRKHWPERYAPVSDETLNRYIGELLSFIWEGGEYLYRKFPI
jgi:hypothetical protein